jgi:hypothetical protein
MTSFQNKAKILAELWMTYREDDAFAEFVEYNDIGLPLAYFISTDLVDPSPKANIYIEESFDLLLASLGLDEDQEFETLNDMLSIFDPE